MQRLTAQIVNFPGTNCESETFDALLKAGFDAKIISHAEKSLKADLIVLPGGFSFGDYVSCGRIAKFSPAVENLRKVVEKRTSFVLGICNGFQILLEAGFLPGALLENESGKFFSDDVELEFLGKTFKLPVANHQGRYFIDDIEKISGFEIMKYKNNPNGSYYDVAGIYDRKNLVFGLMPHPERNYITPFKGENGKIIFDFIKNEIEKEIYGTF